MPEVRELASGESHLAAPALLELRPHLETVEALTARVDALRPGGYRLVGSFEPGDPVAAAVGGFRIADNLVLGRHLYVDDLVTRAALRGRGHADAVMAWIEAEARGEGCAVLHLDSGVQAERAAAHRFYFRHGMRIASYHFSRALD
ncbi:GNAT family N-acetyltransferase [Svornostia abyssi]|uniref:GNAT family N-acetyltransferase n=1 Tax=Svornostia abyssi TaxID=2898438 RepID=A0ABY5PEE3_9ACTN|nr:GNAT family N-acetyltransferase [Parviterribacteraceae bacterium J379]